MGERLVHLKDFFCGLAAGLRMGGWVTAAKTADAYGRMGGAADGRGCLAEECCSIIKPTPWQPAVVVLVYKYPCHRSDRASNKKAVLYPFNTGKRLPSILTNPLDVT